MVYKDYLIAYVLKAKARARRRLQTGDTLNEADDTEFYAQPACYHREKHVRSTSRSRHGTPGHRHDSILGTSDVISDRDLQTQYHVVEQLNIPKDSVLPHQLQNRLTSDSQTPSQAKHSQPYRSAVDLAAAIKQVKGSQH